MVNAKGLINVQCVFADFFFFLREVRNESVKPHFFLWQPHQNDILQDICPSFSAHWLPAFTALLPNMPRLPLGVCRWGGRGGYIVTAGAGGGKTAPDSCHAQLAPDGRLNEGCPQHVPEGSSDPGEGRPPQNNCCPPELIATAIPRAQWPGLAP